MFSKSFMCFDLKIFGLVYVIMFFIFTNSIFTISIFKNSDIHIFVFETSDFQMSHHNSFLKSSVSEMSVSKFPISESSI